MARPRPLCRWARDVIGRVVKSEVNRRHLSSSRWTQSVTNGRTSEEPAGRLSNFVQCGKRGTVVGGADVVEAMPIEADVPVRDIVDKEFGDGADCECRVETI